MENKNLESSQNDKDINLERTKEINDVNSNNLMDENIKQPRKKFTIFNIFLIIIIFVGLLIYMISVDGIDNIINLLQHVDYRWVLAGVGCLILQWVCEAFVLHFPIKRMYPKEHFYNSFKVTMIGQLFNNITPFSSGGQPMQAYAYTKVGVRVSDSLSAMAIKFVITQTALVLFTLIVVAFQFEFFSSLMQDFIWLAIIGFSINIFAIIIVLLAGFNKKAIIFITNPIIRFLGKIKIIKQPDKIIEKLSHSIDNFSNQFNIIRTEKKMVIKMFIMATLQSFAYYSITYMVYKAFGNSGVSFWQIIPVQAFLLLLMTFIPTPGSGLGAEGGFLLLFNSIFQNGTINMSILFWRLYTFYLPILVGAVFLGTGFKIPPKKDKRDTA